MRKRSPDSGVEEKDDMHPKRQKTIRVVSSAEEIQSSRQLQQLLAFDQDAGRAKHGIQSFKSFLEALSENQAAHRTVILKEYLDSQIPRDEDHQTAAYMDDVMKTWSFASQSNNESLLSAVPAVLALLLRVLSSIPNLEQLGLRLGRALLQKRQLELIARSVTANKTKDFIISPAIRLLQQMISVDGGTLARQIFKAREYTLKGLARNLGLGYTGEGAEDRKRPSVRTNTLRLFLVCLKFLPAEEKGELLTQRDISAGVFRSLSSDPAFVLVEFLEILKSNILKDGNLARGARLKFFNATNLGRLVALYGYDHPEYEIPEGKKPIDEVAHEFLLFVCTALDVGVIRRQTGFYPRGMDPDYSIDVEGRQNFIDLGLESLEWATKFTDNVPVRNSTLSEFIQILRPWSNTKQSELLIEIFKSAPELVADYYFNKKSFSFEPKLTATWIGYSAVLFSTVQLSVPPFFGYRGDRYSLVPPPTSIVIESILPKPVTQKALTKCLFNQKSPLITFFAVRLLVIAFQKLKDIMSKYREASAPIWDQAASQLVEEFCYRCPIMLDAINAFRAISDTEIMQRQAASKLLVMFYECIPQVALESKFDVSPYLTDALCLLENTSRGTAEVAMRIMEVENLFQIAHRSPGMRWFNKVDSMPYSPFIAMLRLFVEASEGFPLTKIKFILDSVIKESGLMQGESKPCGLDSLISALRLRHGDPGEIYKFVDNCALRCATTPVKYIDLVDQLHEEAYSGSHRNERLPLSLLLPVIVEQWPFVVRSSDLEATQQIARFISAIFSYSLKIGEDEKIIKSLIKIAVAESPVAARKTIKESKNNIESIVIPELYLKLSPDSIENLHVPKNADQKEAEVGTSLFNFQTVDFEDHRALVRWRNKDIAEIIGDGFASSLVYLLSSPHFSARKEALLAISKLCIKLQKSNDYTPHDQLFLLLMELCETAKTSIDTIPLPTTLTAFAALSIAVLENPLHDLYPKINEFLCSGPKWDIEKIPLVKSILDQPPHTNGRRSAEISWLLTYLSSSLRTPSDMTIFHNRRVFERILTLYNDPYIVKSSKMEILRVLAIATSITDGSTTLITRFSVKSWLEAQIHIEPGEKALSLLLERLLQTCDQGKVETWSGFKFDQQAMSS